MAAGRDAVVNPAAILHGSETDFAGALVPLPTTLASACHARGVRRLRHVGALGVASDSPSRHQPSKAHGEQVRRDADADLTVLRPGGVFGTGDPFLKRFADLQSVFPAAPLAGSRARVQPVRIEGVTSAVVVGLDAGAAGQTIECVGPDVLTLADLVRIAQHCGSRQRPIRPSPTVLGRLQAWMMELAPGRAADEPRQPDRHAHQQRGQRSPPGRASWGIHSASVHSIAPTGLRI